MELINYKENLDKCCIYKIGFHDYDFYYIGSTGCLRKRKETHLRNLKKNTHTSPRLQNVYNKHVKDCYFEVLETTSKEALFDLEQKYIDDHIDNLLNCCFVSGKPPGPKDYKKVAESIKKTVRDKNYNRYLKIKTLVELGYTHQDIMRLARCSSKLLSNVVKMFNLKYDTRQLKIRDIKLIKRYFRFISLDEIKKQKKRKVITYIYNKLVSKFNVEKTVITDISNNKCYRSIII